MAAAAGAALGGAPRAARSAAPPGATPHRCSLLAAAAPLLWALHDLLLTGDPLHSLTGTRDNAELLGRVTGIEHVPTAVPRRLGEILREPVLLAAAGGGLLALAWRRDRRVRLAAAAGVLALAAFCVLAAAGLPIITRYLLLTATLLAIFAGAGVFGWLDLLPGRERTWWARFAALALVVPARRSSRARSARIDRLGNALARQEAIQGKLGELVGASRPARRRSPYPTGARSRCWPCGSTSTRGASSTRRRTGCRRAAAISCPPTPRVARDYILDRRDRDKRIPPPRRALRAARAQRRVASYESRACSRAVGR